MIAIKVLPSSSRSGVEGIRDDRVVVSVHSPPHKGKANQEALKVLARVFGVPPSRLEVSRGHASRNKTIVVYGITPSQALACLKQT